MSAARAFAYRMRSSRPVISRPWSTLSTTVRNRRSDSARACAARRPSVTSSTAPTHPLTHPEAPDLLLGGVAGDVRGACVRVLDAVLPVGDQQAVVDALDHRADPALGLGERLRGPPTVRDVFDRSDRARHAPRLVPQRRGA